VAAVVAVREAVVAVLHDGGAAHLKVRHFSSERTLWSKLLVH
jgi:hypothetical protein